MSNAVGFEASTGLAWEVSDTNLRLSFLESHKKTVVWLSALCFGLEPFLGLSVTPFWGCASPETSGLLYEYMTTSAGSGSVSVGTGPLAGHQ